MAVITSNNYLSDSNISSKTEVEPTWKRLWREGLESLDAIKKTLPHHYPKYVCVVEAIKEQLKGYETIEDLRKRYYENNDWCLEIAKGMYPDQPFLWRLTVIEDAAYGLRAKELDSVESVSLL